MTIVYKKLKYLFIKCIRSLQTNNSAVQTQPTTFELTYKSTKKKQND